MARIVRSAGIAALLAACLSLSGTVSHAATPDPSAHRDVVGGGPAASADWGFAVAVLGTHSLCSGSVISPTRVLTAAHCALRGPLTVIAGRPSLRDASVGEVIPVAQAYVHPEYPLTGRHDLAVLQLAHETRAQPITLASSTIDAQTTGPGSLLGFAGFGERNPRRHGRPLVGDLASVQLRVRSGCQRLYRKVFDPGSEICALGDAIPRRRMSRSACFGDSGGPLVADTPFGPRLVGVASFITSGNPRKRGSLACGIKDKPNVFARVSSDLEFVNSVSTI